MTLKKYAVFFIPGVGHARYYGTAKDFSAEILILSGSQKGTSMFMDEVALLHIIELPCNQSASEFYVPYFGVANFFISSMP
jgi:hypothetical protein